MRFPTLLLVLCLGTLAHAQTSTPFPLADVPILTSAGQKLGTPVPGKPIDLKQYRGKALVVIMIATSCKHCDLAVQALMPLQQEFGPKGLQVVGAAGDPTANILVGPYVDHYHPNFPFGYLKKEQLLTLAHLPSDGRPFVPIVLFVDPKGIVRKRMFGNDPEMKNTELALRQGITDLLAQSAPLLKK